ncbi:MAG: HAD family hydrolase [Pirellulales bacterium]|nr:HAD family hydrolase [Pirellulales bacterium]
MIQAVLFDFGQTLVDSANGFRSAEKEAQALILDNLIASAKKNLSSREFLAKYRDLRKYYQENSNYSRKSLWEAVCSHFGQRADPCIIEQWEEEYWQRVKRMTNVFPETIEVLQTLKQRYKIGLISNTQGQPRSVGHRLGEFPQLERFFESVVIAGESDIPAKPDPMPFAKCLKELGVAAAEAVYVGDDWRVDICGAQDAGLRAIWIKYHSVKRNWPKVETDVPTIFSLKSLLDLSTVLE